MTKLSKTAVIICLVCAGYLAGAYRIDGKAKTGTLSAPNSVSPSKPEKGSEPSSIPVLFAPNLSAQPRTDAEQSTLTDEQEALFESIKEELRAKITSTEQQEQLAHFPRNAFGLSALKHLNSRILNGRYVLSDGFEEELARERKEIEENRLGTVRSFARDAQGRDLPSDPYADLSGQPNDPPQPESDGQHDSSPYFSQVGRAGTGGEKIR